MWNRHVNPSQKMDLLELDVDIELTEADLLGIVGGRAKEDEEPIEEG